MKTTNLPSGAQRTANAGFVWEEVLTNAAGSFKVQQQGTIRVSAVALTTVTIAGVLAATLVAGEVEYFNVGVGLGPDGEPKVDVIIGGAAYVQRAKEIERSGRRSR